MNTEHFDQDNGYNQPQNPAQQDDCETLRALLPAYSMGATDPEETRLVEELLPRCPEVAAELQDFAQINDALLFAAPPVQPPAHLRQAVLAAAKPATAKPATVSAVSSKSQPLFGGLRVAFALAALALVLLVGTNLYWINQVESLRARERDILSLVEQQERMLASFGQQDTQRVELGPTDAAVGTPQAVVYWNDESDISLFTTSGLPTLESRRTYELWLIRGEEAVGVGLFQVSDDGSGALVFNSDEPVSAFDAIGVTEEPEGGSEAPTSAPILVGNI